jgi:uncharacterized membrane protein
MPLHSTHSPSTAGIAGHTFHRFVTSVPIASLTLALATDIAYWRTSNLMWLEFSAWLLLVGVSVGVAAAVFGAIFFLVRFGTRAVRTAWPAAIGTLLVLVLACFNNLVHAADGWTAVMPWGLALSALTVLAILVTIWLGVSVVHRSRVGDGIYD